MTTIELAQAADDKHRFDLPGVGSVRHLKRTSFDSELCTLENTCVQAAMKGVWQPKAEATDAAGTVIGSYEPTAKLSRNGAVQWRGETYSLQSESSWDYSFSLSRDTTVLIQVQTSGWGKHPTTVVIEEDGVEPALLLFTVWLAETFVGQDFAYVAGAT